jgi:uncharacterized protein YbaP (TraB family)
MKKNLFFFVFTLLTNLAIAQNTILWSITSPNSDKTSYVLGTYHYLGNSFVDGKPMIKELLAKSNLAIFESIEDKKTYIDDVMLSRPDDFTYNEVLSKEDVTTIENMITDWRIPISKYKPAELFARIQQKYLIDNCGTIKPTDTTHHFDDYLLSIASKQNLKLMGLETFANQMYAINNPMGEEITWDKYKDAITNFLKNSKSTQFKEAVCKGGGEYLQMKFDYQLKTKCAENDEILIKRNEKWMPEIINALEQNENVFIAVGILHLAGKCGIISQLREKGYKVKPVKIK